MEKIKNYREQVEEILKIQDKEKRKKLLINKFMDELRASLFPEEDQEKTKTIDF